MDALDPELVSGGGILADIGRRKRELSVLLLICTILLTGVAGVLSCRSGLCPRLEKGRSSGARSAAACTAPTSR